MRPLAQVEADGTLSASASLHLQSSLLSCLSSVGPSLLSQLVEGEAAPLLRVNFDPMLIRLLREVKYFLLLEAPVPDSALKVFKRAEVFRQQTGNLELIVNTYNNILVRQYPHLLVPRRPRPMGNSAPFSSLLLPSIKQGALSAKWRECSLLQKCSLCFLLLLIHPFGKPLLGIPNK